MENSLLLAELTSMGIFPNVTKTHFFFFFSSSFFSAVFGWIVDDVVFISPRASNFWIFMDLLGTGGGGRNDDDDGRAL